METELVKPKEDEILRSADSLIGSQIDCVDGPLGKVGDFLFDDQKWGLRYLVAAAGGWFQDRKVLVSPVQLSRPLPTVGEQTLPIRLTKEQLKDSPFLELDAPVSRQFEIEYQRYHQTPTYWFGPALWGATPLPESHSPGEVSEHQQRMAEIEESTLRSISEVVGDSVAATDGDLGKIKDIIIDVQTWKVRYLVLDIGNWIVDREMIVDTDWIESFSYPDQAVVVSLAKDQIKGAPKFDSSEPVNRSYETTLYDFYGKPHYWSS